MAKKCPGEENEDVNNSLNVNKLYKEKGDC